jgi:uncharacterized protein YceH (UPF0502 family)
VPKYQHRFCNTEFGSLKFTPLETAILCELLVRGPQTPGELRTRASRMSEVSDVSEVEAALQNLMARPDGPFVTRLAREAGRRDSRYAHLFCGPVADATTEPEPAAPVRNGDDRVTRLEKRVEELANEVALLKARLGEA